MLTAFPPRLASAELKALQQQVDEACTGLTMTYRKQLAEAFAQCDPELSATRLLLAILQVDALE